MVDEYEKVGKPMIGVQEMPKDVLDRYGIVDLFPNSMRLKGIVEKPEYGTAPSNLASFGRMILNQEIVDELKNTPLGKGGELWIVDAIEKYIKKEWLTTGDPLNYLRATLKYAFDRPELRDEIADFYKNNY